MNVELTPNELLAIKEIAESPYRDSNDLTAPVWRFSNSTYLSGRAYSAAVSSLQRKGLCRCQGQGEDATISLTETGAAVARAEGKV